MLFDMYNLSSVIKVDVRTSGDAALEFIFKYNIMFIYWYLSIIWSKIEGNLYHFN